MVDPPPCPRSHSTSADAGFERAPLTRPASALSDAPSPSPPPPPPARSIPALIRNLSSSCASNRESASCSPKSGYRLRSRSVSHESKNPFEEKHRTSSWGSDETQKEMHPAHENNNNKHVIGTLQLVGITFFAVAGGPYGLEDSVAAAGFLPVIVGLLVFPLLWAMPLAVMTAELSTMIPESGGHIIWIHQAFGPFVSFLNSVASFLCSSFDNALYPVLFLDYIKTLLSPTSACEGNSYYLSPFFQVFVKVVTILCVLFLNFAGVDIVGSASYAFTLIVLSPFMLFLILGTFNFNFNFVKSPSPSKLDWGKYFAIMLWNFSGFDSSGTCAAEVMDPGTVYPRALGLSVTLISASYFFPAVMAMNILPDVSLWCDGSFVVVSNIIGGEFLKGWTALCGSISAFGILLTVLMTSSRLVYGMSCVGQMPSLFAKLDEKTNCPRNALILNAILTFVLSFFDFASLAQIDMMYYGFSTMLKILALLYFRFYQEQKVRPFRIPLGKYSLAVASLIPLGICFLMMYLCNLLAVMVGVLSLILAVGYYFLFGISSTSRFVNSDGFQPLTQMVDREEEGSIDIHAKSNAAAADSLPNSIDKGGGEPHGIIPAHPNLHAYSNEGFDGNQNDSVGQDNISNASRKSDVNFDGTEQWIAADLDTSDNQGRMILVDNGNWHIEVNPG